ncbi:hypothetical protein L0Y49_04170, partial [bacterium]|nr:hypothetical protein [bacterium]
LISLGRLGRKSARGDAEPSERESPATLPGNFSGRTPKENPLSFFQKKSVARKIRKARSVFFRGCRAERGGGGAFVHHEFLIK